MMNITEIRRPGALEVARTYVAKKALLRRVTNGIRSNRPGGHGPGGLALMGLPSGDLGRRWTAIYVVAAVLVWMALHFLSPLFLKIVLGHSRPLSYRDALGVPLCACHRATCLVASGTPWRA